MTTVATVHGLGSVAFSGVVCVCVCGDHVPFCGRKLLATMECADSKKNIDFSNNKNSVLKGLVRSGGFHIIIPH